MTLKMDVVRTLTDVEKCVDIYLSIIDSQVPPADRKASIKSLAFKIRRRRFVRVMKDDSEIVAWLYADIIRLDHTNYDVLQQVYYASCLTGIPAYRALVALHEAMYDYAETTSARYCISNGSCYDTTNVLARSLGKNGWNVKGFMAFREVLPAPLPG